MKPLSGVNIFTSAKGCPGGGFCTVHFNGFPSATVITPLPSDDNWLRAAASKGWNLVDEEDTIAVPDIFTPEEVMINWASEIIT